MKNSKFNNYISLNKGYNIVYNSLSNKFLIHKLDMETIKDFNNIKQTNVDAYSNLVSGGFVVEDGTDEDEILNDIKQEKERK